MANPSGTSVISKPSGGGALQGLGEKFSPDLFTGTGNFSVPIALPPGRNGFQPQLSLQYSTGQGNSAFGLGWGISVPNVSRKTSKGVPVYDEGKDVFILSGAEDLIKVSESPVAVRYRPRTEGLFARIVHHFDADNDYWQVQTKDGLVSFYGTPGKKGNDPATLTDPASANKIFSWHLSKTVDPFGNCILYEYTNDRTVDGVRAWNQLYLTGIRYLDHGDPTNPEFLVSIHFHYEDRSDAFSSYRQGFEIRTQRRCTVIESYTHHGTAALIRRYDLQYLDEAPGHHNLPSNGVSLLHRVAVTGFKDGLSESLPSLTFNYSGFSPDAHDLIKVTGKDLPSGSLARSEYELVDMTGNGLPDILEMAGGPVRYWRNLGNGVFDLPRSMPEVPAGLVLSSPDVQLIDANGDARVDLMVNAEGISGYYSTEFGGIWSKKTFRKYPQAPSFSLQDPEVKLVDLDGDGVTDAIRNGARFECFFHDAEKGWHKTRTVERKTLEDFPSVSFADARVRWADMCGDGMQDIVFITEGSIAYWPNLGHGNFAPKVQMRHCPRLPNRYDPKRLLLGDVDGDGVADLIYVENNKITLWINQNGNVWSAPIEINGTPGITDWDNVRLEDILGRGVAGVLWSSDANSNGRGRMFFLDLTKGQKPYLLNETNNHMGAVTKVFYKSSIEFYLEDEKLPETRWKTTLPFPVLTVSKVEVIDQLSLGKLITEYRYHHGYWDGIEREFRGFGRVDQLDTETFDRFNENGLSGNQAFNAVKQEHYTPPLETRSWFHLGAVGDQAGDWTTPEFTGEYWQGDVKVFPPLTELEQLLLSLPRRAKRDAFRALRGNILRTELYARDGSSRQDKPYTVTEAQFSARLEYAPPEEALSGFNHIFFPFAVAQRSTQWERGDDPMTQLSFTDDYDAYGQPRSQVAIAVPRGREYARFNPNPAEPYLATFNATTFCEPVETDVQYMTGRTCRVNAYEIQNEGKQDVFTLAREILSGNAEYNLIAQNLVFYDGPAFEGLPFGQIGLYGLPSRNETLILTDDIIQQAYGARPAYLETGAANWPAEYPADFQNTIPNLAGYRHHDHASEPEYNTGYFAVSGRVQYDFQAGVTSPRGLSLAMRDPFDHESVIEYDSYQFLPVKVRDPQGMEVTAEYDYSTMQVKRMTDPNGNQSEFAFSPLGLLQKAAVMGKPGEHKGDTLDDPGIRYEYDFFAFEHSGDPVWVKTISREHHIKDQVNDNTLQVVEYSDGFGRLLQTRAQTDEVLFGDALWGDSGLPVSQTAPNAPAVGIAAPPGGRPNVVVSGWKIYNNKGWVVEQYEPFFDKGWDYIFPSGGTGLGQKIRMFYDPRGNAIRNLNPDGTEQRVLYGVPSVLSRPDLYAPTPWEQYTYDANDLTPLTHPGDTTVPPAHYYTPNSNLLDALGRTIRTTNHRAQQTISQPGASPVFEDVVMQYRYDIRGNLLEVHDPYGRSAFSHVYDLKPKTGKDDPGANILRTKHIDGGIKTAVFSGIGSPVEMRDSKGALLLHAYDNLNRPTHAWARDLAAEPVTLRQRLLYGDAAGLTDPAAHNLLGKPWKTYDEAGMVTLPEYDFKGNPLYKERRVLKDSQILSGIGAGTFQSYRVDWTATDPQTLETQLLDGRVYRTSLQYDALGRTTRVTYPIDADGDRKVLYPTYNRAGALQKISLERYPGQLTDFIKHIAYNAKGQRLLVAYGNGIMTRYAYHPLHFRLMRVRSEGFTQAGWTFSPQSGAARQDCAYRYDLNGNIVSMRDKTPQSGIAPTPDELLREFAYDPLNRLLQATGRESDVARPAYPWEDSPVHNDPTQVRAYTQAYAYDKLGNIQWLQHINPGGTGNFTREFHYTAGGNTLQSMDIGSNNYTFQYDANGNQTRETLSRFFEWDHSDRLRAFYEMAGSTPSVHAQYLYDSGGNRVKKLARKQNGQVVVTVYIDGIFEHDYIANGGTIQEENTTLHLMDDRVRVATLRVGPPLSGDTTPALQYNLEDHLGNSTALLNEYGGWISREEYFPFGESSFGRFGKKKYRFVGKQKDEESGLYYYGARYYAAWVCRFISVDPLFREYAYYTPYQYAGNKPINYIDIDGLEEGEAKSPPKKRAHQLVDEFEKNSNSPQAFTNISKEDIIKDLRSIIDYPSEMTIPYDYGYYCSMHAISYETAYYSPDKYTKAVLDLYQFGEATINLQDISTSKSLQGATPPSEIEPSVFIYGVSLRETYNDTPYWNSWYNLWFSTAGGTMGSWLYYAAGLQVQEFDYGYELFSKGISKGDLTTLKSHIDSGNSAVLLVNGDKYETKLNNRNGGFYGDHYIVLQDHFEVFDDKVFFKAYDSHEGLIEQEMKLNTFMNMINLVLMVSKIEPGSDW